MRQNVYELRPQIEYKILPVRQQLQSTSTGGTFRLWPINVDTQIIHFSNKYNEKR